MVGAPVAALLATCCWTAKPTASVATLVSVSPNPASSVNDTRTLIVLPSSPDTKVCVESAPPVMSVSEVPSLATHW